MYLLVCLKALLLRIKFALSGRSVVYKIIKKPRNKGSLNVVYVLYSEKNMKSGGHKVIYKQSELINNLNGSDFKSSVLHVGNASVKHNWFDHKVDFKKDHYLDPLNDFVIIPEIMVLKHTQQLTKNGISYAIFVQNGFLIDAYSHKYDELALAYKNASVILAISEDAANCVITSYPWAANKIVRIYYSIDTNKFKSSKNKENLITYMPRKLSRHASLVKFFLNENLPEGWKLKEVDGLNEAGVIDLLSKSKIFLSFSELEGLGLPPAEAALCGNYVVGYTGEGGKEYWKAPIFTEVYCGDVKKFVNEILAKIEQLKTQSTDSSFESARVELAEKYSEPAEKQSLLNFLHKAESILNAKSAEV